MTPEEIKEFSKLQERIVVYREMEQLNKQQISLLEQLFKYHPDGNTKFMLRWETKTEYDHYGSDAYDYRVHTTIHDNEKDIILLWNSIKNNDSKKIYVIQGELHL
jgi:hypothetical protein